MRRLFLSVTCFAALVASIVGQDVFRYPASSHPFKIVKDENNCTTTLHTFNPFMHKPKYRVGVYNSEGDDLAYEYYNLTFVDYLTATAGRKFDPPIQFEMVPVTMSDLMNMAETEEVDFMFASSAVSSCMATEHEAQPLVTIINRRESRGHLYDLDQYGGVIFTLADNDEVNVLEDIKDRTVGSGGITAMGGAQTQFYELFLHGISFVADPKQMVFTNNEKKTVDGLLNGDFEIGFVRTDQIERQTDANGKTLDPDLFKVINTQTHVLDDGTIFPFIASTSLHPEWPVCALNHVAREVSKEVQEALLALYEHSLLLETGKNLLCETTPELAELALSASKAGIYKGFRTARSYFQVRTKQQAAGILREYEDGQLHCARGDALYEDVICPAGTFKLRKKDFERSCELIGMECKEGYQCYCKPCVVPHERIFQYFEDDPDWENAEGCKERSLCGQIEQNKEIVMRIIDNVRRINPKVEARMHFGAKTEELTATEVPDKPWTYEIRFVTEMVAVGILEITFDGEEIPMSPVRVEVIERQCELEYPGQGKVASKGGSCVCGSGTVAVGKECVDIIIFAIVGALGGLLLICTFAYFYTRYSNQKNDQIWQVNVDELHFDDPVEVIGQGSFGVVLLAEYRGTKVAIKRALKSHDKRGSTKAGGKKGSSGLGMLGSASASVRPPVSTDGSVGLASRDSTFDMESQVPVEISGRSMPPRESSIVEGAGKSCSGESLNIDFLAADYGKHKRHWLFPWIKKSDYQTRFKESILGQSATATKVKAKFCPWFDKESRQKQEFMKEMRILSRLRHPCITTVMGAVVSHRRDPMLVMEHMQNGSLYDLLRNESMFFGGDIILQVLRDVAQGLRFLHTNRPPILHGDLKSRNILIDSRFRAKLCDFGLSQKKEGNGISGTPFWLAPEYLRGESQYKTAADVYSIGIVIYEVYSRKSPYQDENFREVLRKVCNRRVNKRPEIPDTCPPKLVDLMKKCWSPDPTYRPSARELDMTLLDMNIKDAEPSMSGQNDTPTNLSLDELFPKHIAKALKAGEKVEAEDHENVTIVFSDIVGFTDISRQISPIKVSKMLDRLFLQFDRIAKKHYLFKVETIGDAYMGVTNLEGNQEENHAKHVAEFAIDMINAASKVLIDEEEPNKGYIHIRVGFHSGPVVSNVIGSLNPRYGLFGDTVNTASRMESNSAANRILCSEKAAKLLKEQAPKMPLKKRGKISVKGKGDMNVYWVGDGLIETTEIDGKLPNSLERNVGFSVDEADETEASAAPPESAPSN